LDLNANEFILAVSINREDIPPTKPRKMTNTNNTISAQIVYDLLKGASWDYEHCGDRIKSDDMDEYISDIEDNISLPVVESAINDSKAEIESTFDEDGDINRWAAVFIADAVAQQVVDCIYQTVTFKANL
jgi:hypothetical protein